MLATICVLISQVPRHTLLICLHITHGHTSQELHIDLNPGNCPFYRSFASSLCSQIASYFNFSFSTVGRFLVLPVFYPTCAQKTLHCPSTTELRTALQISTSLGSFQSLFARESISQKSWFPESFLHTRLCPNLKGGFISTMNNNGQVV